VDAGFEHTGGPEYPSLKITSKLALELKITEIVLLSNRYILPPFQNIRCLGLWKKYI
jgi:hypothetical protein